MDRRPSRARSTASNAGAIWETWNAVLDAGVDVPAELAERRGLREVQQLQHDELLMREFYGRQTVEEEQRQELAALVMQGPEAYQSPTFLLDAVTFQRPASGVPQPAPVWAERPQLHHRLLAEVEEGRRRFALERAEEAGRMALRQQVQADAHRAQREAVEHEEEEDRYYEVEVEQMAAWRDLLASAAARRQLALAASHRDPRARLRYLEGWVPSPPPAAARPGLVWQDGLLQRHWQLEEEEVVGRQLVREEERLAAWMLGRRLEYDLALHRNARFEEGKRRDIVLDRIRQFSEATVAFHRVRKELEERPGPSRPRRAPRQAEAAEQRVLLDRAAADCSFWEMRRRWEIEGEEDAGRQLLFLEEGSAWAQAETRVAARLERQREEAARAGFPLHAAPPPAPPPHLRHPDAVWYIRAGPDPPKPPAAEATPQDRAIARLNELLSPYSDASLQSADPIPLPAGGPPQGPLGSVAAGVVPLAPIDTFAERCERLDDDATQEKAHLYAVAATLLQLMVESCALQNAAAYARTRLLREEHVEWTRVQDSIVNVAYSVTQAFLLEEHHARVQLTVEEQEAWHRLLADHSAQSGRWLRAAQLQGVGATEAKARQEVEREEWAFFYQLGLRFEDAAPERAVYRCVMAEEAARQAVVAEEGPGLAALLATYNAYIDRWAYHDTKLLVKDESVARRKIEQEMGRRLEDLAMLRDAARDEAQGRCRRRQAATLQRWWRGERGRREARHVGRLRRAHDRALAIQCWWRCVLARRRCAALSVKMAKRRTAQERAREFEIIERVEMEAHEKLLRLQLRRQEHATLTLTAEEASFRRELEKQQRRGRAEVTDLEAQEKLALLYTKPTTGAKRRPSGGAAAVGAAAPATLPLLRGAAPPTPNPLLGTWPLAAQPLPTLTVSNDLDPLPPDDSLPDVCTQAIHLLTRAAENRRRFEQEMAALQDTERRLPTLPQSPAFHQLAQRMQADASGARKLSPLTSPGADRQRALKEIRAFALRQPLAGYGPALEASGHYNCQYLEKKTGRPTTGAVQLPAINPTEPFHAWAATPQPMVHF